MASRQQYVLEILLGAKTAASYQSSINNAKSGMTSMSSHAKKIAGLITSTFATVNVAQTIKEAIDVYSGFEQELANSAAIAGASNTEYTKMEKREMPEKQRQRQPKRVQVRLDIWHLPDGMSINQHNL